MRDDRDSPIGVRNLCAAQLKKQVTINLDAETVDYFKAQAEETGIPYQRLINFYLADCVKNKRRLAWI